MAKPRKTVPLKSLVGRANRFLAASKLQTPEDRAARLFLSDFISSVLLESDAYAGYALQRSEYLPSDEQTLDNVLIPDYDDSARVMFLKETH